MLKELYKEELPVLTAVKCQPCVSVIMPFNPKMGSKTEIMHSLKIATDKVKHELYKNYKGEIADNVLKKMDDVIRHLDFRTHRKSIAIYISPLIQKVYYLNITVTEKIVVDSSFEIRDLVLNRKDNHEILIVVISAKKEKIFAGNDITIKQIVSNSSAHVKRDLPEPVANFSDFKKVKETRLKNFLRYIDNRLLSILKVYPLPVFIMATEKTLGYFKQITKHNQYITGYAHGNFEDASEHELLKALEPQLQNWSLVKQKNAVNKLSVAQNDFKLASGMQDVWKHANRKHGQLLVVEKDFNCPAFVGENGETVFCNDAQDDATIGTKDAVNDVIEKVLASGGDVEFVDELKDYNHIALIEYYHEN